MPSRKCLWDNSHTFEVDENDTYLQLCPSCYHNIFCNILKKIMTWEEFIESIEEIKLAFKYVSALDSYYKNNIKQLTASNSEKEDIEMICLICDKTQKIAPNDSYQFLCKSCAHKFYFQLKKLRSMNQIKKLILSIKKISRSTEELMERLTEFINEN